MSQSTEERVYLLVAQAYDRLSRSFDTLFRDHGLSQALYNVLRIVRGARPDGLSCHVIAQRLITRHPDVTRLIDRLLAAGLVTRERSASDRRVVLVQITAAGLEKLRELDPLVESLHQRQLGGLGHEKLQQTENSLTTIVEQIP